MEACWSILEVSCGLLEAAWSIIGATWGVLKSPGWRLRCVLACFECLQAVMEPSSGGVLGILTLSGGCAWNVLEDLMVNLLES